MNRSFPASFDPTLPNGKHNGDAATHVRATKVWTDVEIIVRLRNGRADLADIVGMILAQGVRVVAHSCYGDKYGTVLHLVTENNSIAKNALEARGYACKATVVLVAEVSSRHAVVQLGLCLGRAGVHIQYAYTTPPESEKLFAVFKTMDYNEMFRLLKTGQLAPKEN